MQLVGDVAVGTGQEFEDVALWTGRLYDSMKSGNAVVRCGDVTIKSSELDIEFEVPFDDDMEANEAEITVYNLSKSTICKLKRKSGISIEAGYNDDTGVIFNGYIDKVSTKYSDTAKPFAPVSSVPITHQARYKLKVSGEAVVSASPIESGDVVICVCCDRDITAAKQGKSVLPPAGHHTMSDCVIVGIL